jgi:hypothetical protein
VPRFVSAKDAKIRGSAVVHCERLRGDRYCYSTGTVVQQASVLIEHGTVLSMSEWVCLKNLQE